MRPFEGTTPSASTQRARARGELCPQIRGVAMRESDHRFPRQRGGLAHAVVCLRVHEHHIRVWREGLHGDVISRVAGGEVERGVAPEELRGEAFHLQLQRAGAKPRAGCGGVDAILEQGLATGGHHLRMSVQPQVAGACEV